MPRAPDGRIWLDDSVEVLLQPTGRFHYQFGITSRGTRFDARMPVADDISGEKRWPAALSGMAWGSAVSEGDGEWRIELRIPLATLDRSGVSPRLAPEHRAHGSPAHEYSAWAPVEKGFTTCSRFRMPGVIVNR